MYTRETRGIPYPYIRWKYWQEYYSQHCVKAIESQKEVVSSISGDLYSIPGDTGKPWRFNKMVEYIGNFPDEIGPIINAWFKQTNASDDDKVWWVFLYSTCYCMGSAMVMAKTLDYAKPLSPEALEDYWAQNKPKLIFQSDRRYIKNMNQFTHMVKEFLTRTGGKLYEYISQFVTDNPEETYRRLYEEISTWKYYGRFGTILFIFNLCKVFPHIQVESKIYDWKTGATTTSAIFNARYEDEKANAFDAGKVTLTDKDIKILDATLQIITDELQKYKPEKKWNIIYVSSDLCSFRKLFKGVRYQGYYVDRQQEEIQILQHNFPEHLDIWQFVWVARHQNIDNKYLGEVNGWTGIRKERMKLFLEHGYVGADP